MKIALAEGRRRRVAGASGRATQGVAADGAPQALPVFDLEAEAATLGAALIDPEETRSTIAETFDPEAFYLQEHQEIAAAVASRWRKSEAFDPVILRGELLDGGKRDAAELVFPLSKGLGTAANVGHYWRRLMDLAERREQGRPDELAALSLAEVLHQVEARVEQGVPHLATGFPKLDTALGGGFTVPSLNVLGAGPKSGKSTFAQIVAVQHVERGGVAYVLDLENGRPRFGRQLLCRRSRLGPRDVARALRDQRAGVFTSRTEAERWQKAKAWARETLGRALFVEFAPPQDLTRTLTAIRKFAGDRQLLVVIDSLQKLPGSLEDRRATVDGWVRYFERLRHQLDAVFLVISEIKRDMRGGYRPSESAFKESGGIEYAADLAMTLTRPSADEDEAAVSTLRVELARDCDEDPRGDVASYAPVRPFYGLEEVDPVPRKASGSRGRSGGKAASARDFLQEVLTEGPVHVSEVLARGRGAGFSEATLQRAKRDLDVGRCTLECKSAWRLP